MGYNSWRNKDWETIFYNLRNGIYFPFLRGIYKTIFRYLPHDGVDVVDEDWDYLIILDACRYDVFEEVNWIEGDLQKKISKGSGSPDWLRSNFTDYYEDIVYVSANGFVSSVEKFGGFDSSEHFPRVIETYNKDSAMEKGVVKPESVVDDALKAQKEYPNKRKIIHFAQPHDPFIGDPSLTLKDGDVNGKLEYFTHPKGKEAYKANLERALTQVEKLIENLEGKIVISADHGDAFGEKGVLRHADGIYTKELVEIPWLVIEKGDRPDIDDQIPKEKNLDEEATEKEIKKSLEDLGYF